jgi:rsbT co-antagonist protein RsbR
MNSVSNVAEYLIKNAESLAVEIIEDFIHRTKVEVSKVEKDQGLIIYTQFIGFFGKSLTLNEEEMPEGLSEWSKKNGEREASLTGKISDIVVLYPTVRVVFTEHITKSA